MRDKASAMAVVLATMHTARCKRGKGRERGREEGRGERISIKPSKNEFEEGREGGREERKERGGRRGREGGREGGREEGTLPYLHAGQVTAGDDGGGLVVDAALEPGRAPVDKLDGALGLDVGHRRVDVLGHDVAAVHQASSHVLAVARVALGHPARRLEGRVGDLGDRELLVVGLLRRDDRSVRRKHEMDARVRHEVGLELRDVDVEGAVEAERRSKR